MLEAFLKARGYGEAVPDPIYRSDGVVYWYKKLPQTIKHQVSIKRWPGKGGPSFEVEMTYETRNEVWATTKFYGLTESELKENLDRLESCLQQALLYMDANPLHYRFNGED